MSLLYACRSAWYELETCVARVVPRELQISCTEAVCHGETPRRTEVVQHVLLLIAGRVTHGPQCAPRKFNIGWEASVPTPLCRKNNVPGQVIAPSKKVEYLFHFIHASFGSIHMPACCTSHVVPCHRPASLFFRTSPPRFTFGPRATHRPSTTLRSSSTYLGLRIWSLL